MWALEVIDCQRITQRTLQDDIDTSIKFQSTQLTIQVHNLNSMTFREQKLACLFSSSSPWLVARANNVLCYPTSLETLVNSAPTQLSIRTCQLNSNNSSPLNLWISRIDSLILSTNRRCHGIFCWEWIPHGLPQWRRVTWSTTTLVMQRRGMFQENVKSDVSQSDLTVTCSKACIFHLWKVFSGVRPFAGHDRRSVYNAIVVSLACQ